MSDKYILLFARVSASNARIESMKAANVARVATGQALAYLEQDFAYEADYIESLWRDYQ